MNGGILSLFKDSEWRMSGDPLGFHQPYKFLLFREHQLRTAFATDSDVGLFAAPKYWVVVVMPIVIGVRYTRGRRKATTSYEVVGRSHNREATGSMVGFIRTVILYHGLETAVIFPKPLYLSHYTVTPR